MTAALSTMTSCKNCDATLPDPSAKFCPHCGQETHLEPLTVGEYIHEFVGHYVAVESKLWTTLKMLYAQPGQLAIEYREGRRNRYIRPLRLVITVFILSLLIQQGIQWVHPASNSVELQAKIAVDNLKRDRESAIKQAERRGIAEAENAALRTPSAQESLEFQRKRASILDKLQLYFLFVYAPLYAVVLKFLYRGRPYRLGDYLVFQLYLSSAGTLMWIWSVPLLAYQQSGGSGAGWFLFLVVVAVVWHTHGATRRAYGRPEEATFLKTGGYIIGAGLVSFAAIRVVDRVIAHLLLPS